MSSPDKSAFRNRSCIFRSNSDVISACRDIEALVGSAFAVPLPVMWVLSCVELAGKEANTLRSRPGRRRKWPGERRPFRGRAEARRCATSEGGASSVGRVSPPSPTQISVPMDVSTRPSVSEFSTVSPVARRSTSLPQARVR